MFKVKFEKMNLFYKNIFPMNYGGSWVVVDGLGGSQVALIGKLISWSVGQSVVQFVDWSKL
jgi:hypothetical protein